MRASSGTRPSGSWRQAFIQVKKRLVRWRANGEATTFAVIADELLHARGLGACVYGAPMCSLKTLP
jgi:hypothetical protein